MPRSVPFFALNETLHCASRGFRPCFSNSCWQNDRAKKPRSSLPRSSSTTKAPASGEGWNIKAGRSRQDGDLGDRHHEAAAPVADISDLSSNLVLQVPRQDEDVVGPRFLQ